jgi:hypothetical protein
MIEDAMNYPCECGTPTGEMEGCRHCGIMQRAYNKICKLEQLSAQPVVTGEMAARLKAEYQRQVAKGGKVDWKKMLEEALLEGRV